MRETIGQLQDELECSGMTLDPHPGPHSLFCVAKPDRSTCPHGVKPWFNCEECCKESNYSFKGDFK